MSKKTKKRITFKQKENGDLDFRDKRLSRFMTIPFQFESIMMFGKMWNDYAMCFGIGMVSKIVNTDRNYDIVYMNFGKSDRPVIVWEYNARKQMATLSRNKYAIFYGFLKVLKKDQKRKTVIYARALQGLYVPTAFDLKKKYPNVNYDEKNEKDEQFTEFLSDIQEIKDD